MKKINERDCLSLIGSKVCMTYLFLKNGNLVPVTAIHVSPNVVSLVKNKIRDGYDSVQLAYGDCKEKRLNRSQAVNLSSKGISPKKVLREFLTSNSSNYYLGQILDLSLFKEGEKVKITGNNKGKGFSGVIVRHGQSTGPNSHGSGFHRGVGSMGPISPNHIRKGKKLPGRLGNQRNTISNLLIMKIDSENNLLYVKGSVPGNKKNLLMISKVLSDSKENNN